MTSTEPQPTIPSRKPRGWMILALISLATAVALAGVLAVVLIKRADTPVANAAPATESSCQSAASAGYELMVKNTIQLVAYEKALENWGLLAPDKQESTRANLLASSNDRATEDTFDAAWKLCSAERAALGPAVEVADGCAVDTLRSGRDLLRTMALIVSSQQKALNAAVARDNAALDTELDSLKVLMDSAGEASPVYLKAADLCISKLGG